MKIEQFKEKKYKKRMIIGSMVAVVLLVTITILYRTFAIYKEVNQYDAIKGIVPDQNYDTMFVFYKVDSKGVKTSISTIPEGKEWNVTVVCNKGALGSWDTVDWGPVVSNLTESRTKCSVTFAPKSA